MVGLVFFTNIFCLLIRLFILIVFSSVIVECYHAFILITKSIK